MLSANTYDFGDDGIINRAEEILWKELPSNATIIKSLEERKLSNETSLPEMHSLLSFLGYKARDFDSLNVIHIAGSKGKGSTAAFTESILRGHGLKTALYTSPHLVHPRERLRINGISMGVIEFSRAVIDTYEKLKNGLRGGPLPGLFRFLTLLVLDHMKKLQSRGLLDVAIIEVGMGGRFDSTNIFERPSITAITSLVMEHVKTLGPSLTDIANHKVGIAKQNVPLLSVFQVPEAEKAIQKYATQIGASLIHVGPSALDEINLSATHLGIAGDHQKINAGLACKICTLWLDKHGGSFNLNPLKVLKAFQTTYWPGRHQTYKDELNRTWYLDGAHTIESIQYAIDWFLKQVPKDESDRILVFHCSHDRSYEYLLKPLVLATSSLMKEGSVSSLFKQAIFARPLSPTDIDGTDLSLHYKMAEYWTSVTNIPSKAALTNDLLELIPSNASVLATGSLYLVGDLLRDHQIPIL